MDRLESGFLDLRQIALLICSCGRWPLLGRGSLDAIGPPSPATLAASYAAGMERKAVLGKALSVPKLRRDLAKPATIQNHRCIFPFPGPGRGEND